MGEWERAGGMKKEERKGEKRRGGETRQRCCVVWAYTYAAKGPSSVCLVNCVFSLNNY